MRLTIDDSRSTIDGCVVVPGPKSNNSAIDSHHSSIVRIVNRQSSIVAVLISR